MNTESPPLPTIIWKLSKQCALPAILALSYAYWDYINAQQQNVPAFLKSFGVAFFLIMWFVGLFMRASKQVSDAASFADLHVDVTAIRTRMAAKDDVIAFITKTYAQRDGQGQDLLIVVDVQKDFCKGGVLEVYDSARVGRKPCRGVPPNEREVIRP